MNIKKLFCLFLMVFSFFLLVSCEKITDTPNNDNNTNENDNNENDNNENNNNNEGTTTSNYEITFIIDTDKTVKKEYEAETKLTADKILTDVFNGVAPTKEGYETNLDWYTSAEYAVKITLPYEVKANASLYLKWNKMVLKEATLYVVGDSTLSPHGDNYPYPRDGYGEQLQGYLDSKIKVKNYAKSGRSASSYLEDGEYKLVMDGDNGSGTKLPCLSEGDYLMIGFGHNDSKTGDPRFASASQPTSKEGSFKYNLYEYYVKPAIERGATPILCTPITRLDSTNSYTGKPVHDNTAEGIGDYRQAVIELGEEFNVAVLDMTKATADVYKALGYEEAKWFHAFPGAKYDDYGNVVVDESTVDGTHLNQYGSKFVAYKAMEELAKTDCMLKYYIKSDITCPTKENDLKWNSLFRFNLFYVPVLDKYEAPDHFKTTSEGWYGTAFGNTTVNPSEASSGFVATETSTGVFKVGQTGTKKYGKFSDSATSNDGFAFVFQQIDKSNNFVLTADAKVLTAYQKAGTAFGLMVRDDCYIRQTESIELQTNFVSSAVMTSTSCTYDLLSRTTSSKSTALSWKNSQIIDGLFAAELEISFKIERINQVIYTTITYNGVETKNQYPDFDLLNIDKNNLYVGMFATYGTVVEFTNVNLELTGTALDKA